MVATLDFVPACHGASMYIMSMIVSVTECSLNSPPDWKWGVSVNWFLGRRSWEMESWVE